MKWQEYYERFWDWSESTQISRISTLTDFTSSAEVAEIANEFLDETISTRLVRRAMQNGIRFTPAEINRLGGCVTEDVFNEAVRSRQGRFTAEQFMELEGICDDEDMLMSVARKDGICRWSDDLPFDTDIDIMMPVKKSSGFFAALFDVASDASARRTHAGRCTGDCSSCPEHGGYRYGRWYHGRHHSHGCEFGGNDGSGMP